MGKKKKTTIGYRYYMGLFMGLCRGPVDAIRQIRVGDKVAWTGRASGNTTININQPALFGGDEQEGGIDGPLQIMMGAPDQPRNESLAAMLGGLVSAHRGVVTAFFDGLVCAMSPYPKEWAYLVQKTKQGWHGGQTWYPEKCEIWLTGSTIRYDDLWAYKSEPAGSTADYSSPNYDDSGWEMGRGGFGTGAPPESSMSVNTPVPSGRGVSVWIRRRINVPNDVTVNVYHDDGAWLWIDGIPQDLESISYYHSRVTIPAGQHVIALKVTDGVPGGSDNIFAAIDVVSDDITIDVFGMNPAHILYRLYTDPRTGRGLPAALRLDEQSFREVADKCYAEGLGLCLKWSRTTPIADFAQQVLDHAGLVVYTSRRTGKLVLKAIRDDYDIDDLPLFTPDTGLLGLDDDASSSQSSGVNEICVNYFDVLNKQDAAVREKNLGSIMAMGGVTISEDVTYEGIASEALARRLARRDLNAKSGFIKRFEVRLDRRGKDLMPGSVFRISDPQRGIENMVLRAGRVERGAITDGTTTVTALQDVFGLPSTVYREPEENGYVPPDSTPRVPVLQTAVEANYRDLVQLGQDMAALSPEAGFVHGIAVEPSPLSESFDLRTRVAPAEYASRDDLGAFCPGGTIAEDVGPMDIVLTLSTIAGLADVELGTAALLGDEIVRVDAIDTTSGTVTVGRGCVDTVPVAHTAGTPIYFYDTAGGVDQTEYVQGVTVDAKLLTRTSSGILPEAAALELSVGMQARAARPYPPANVKINGEYYPAEVSGEIVVTWAHRDRKLQADNLIAWNESDVGPEPGTTYNVEYYTESDTVPVASETGITGTGATPWTPPFDGAYRVEAYSVLDALESLQRYLHVVIVGAKLWTPAQLTNPAQVWFNDTSPVTEVSGALSQVNDLSANGFHMTQTTASARPTRVAGVLNGLPVFRLDGNNDRMFGPNTTPGTTLVSNVAEAWSVAVYRSSTTNVSNRYLFGADNTGGSNARFLDMASSTTGGSFTNRPGVGGRALIGDNFSQALSAAAVGTDWVMALKRIKFATKTGIVNVNGEADESTTMVNMTAGNSAAAAHNPFTFGCNSGSGNNFFGGDVAELVFGTGTLDGDEIDKLFGYLAWKWNLVDPLPVDHPYKHAPPYINTPVLQPSFASDPVVIGFVAEADSGDVGVAAGPAVTSEFGTLLNSEPSLTSGQGITVTSDGSDIAIRLDGLTPPATPAQAVVLDHKGSTIGVYALTDGGGYYTASGSGVLTDGGVYYVRIEAV